QDGIDLTAGHFTGAVSGVGGNLRNTGQIFAGDDGIDINTSSVVTGAVVNSGRIEADSDGIHVSYAAQVQGGISNTATGVIQVGGDGIDVSWNGAQAQAISNEGTITAAQSGIEVDSTAHIVGAISNSGSITGDLASIFIESGSSVGGGISNSGTLTGPLKIDGDDGLGGGIDVVNSGTIDIGASESFISGDYAQQAGGKFKLTLKNLTDYLAAPITIVGDAVLAGALDFSFVPAFNPIGGVRFTVFDIGGARTGGFANQPQDALLGVFGTVSVYLDYLAEGNIDLYTVPEPDSFALLGVGAFAWRAGRRRLG
ncbi:MAG: PEP-CTERM sorting domain-containing protein, partial [Candidatus Methylumidiphilus sp.]